MLANRLTLRAFARQRGVQLSAVQRAIAEGRLTQRSIGRTATGRPFVKDPTRAAREWEDRTRPRVAATGAGANGAGASPSALARATQRERENRAKLLDLEYAKKSRELVPAREVEARWAAQVVAARTVLLGLPTRAKQRLPHLMATDLAELDRLVREALEELAGDNNHTEGEGR